MTATKPKISQQIFTNLKDFGFFLAQSLRDLTRITQIDSYWFIIWISIYLGFLTLDLFNPHFVGSSLIKYLGIFLCIIYAATKHAKDKALLIALVFTFLADTILVWTSYELLGLIVFCFAQYMHSLRLFPDRRRVSAYYLTVLLTLGTLSFFQNIPALYAVAALYALSLLANTIISYQNLRTHKDSFPIRCATYGFIAFICCDFCVAARHLMLNQVLPTTFLPLVAYLVWVFYYPSQVLLANSSQLTPEKKASSKIAKTEIIG